MNLTNEPNIIIIYQSEGNNPGSVCIQRGMNASINRVKLREFG